MEYSFTILSCCTDIVEEAINGGMNEEDAFNTFLDSLRADIQEQLLRRRTMSKEVKQ